MSRGYQRAHLRAPFRGDVLFADEGHVHRAVTLNMSEGGCLLREIPHFPVADDTPLMFSLPQFPMFKNFTLLKLRTFGADMFPAKVVRARGKLVRKGDDSSDVDEVFRTHVGIRFTEVTPVDQRVIAAYVENFAANLVHLQMLLDSWNTSSELQQKTRVLANHLGYAEIYKVSELRARVRGDYLSLQW